jgi:hypothetical protein
VLCVNHVAHDVITKAETCHSIVHIYRTVEKDRLVYTDSNCGYCDECLDSVKRRGILD